MVGWETCISVGDLADEVPSRGFEGPGPGFFVSASGGSLVVAGGDLFRVCNRGSVNSESMVACENIHLAGRDIRPGYSLDYLIGDGPCGFLEEHCQVLLVWLEWAYSNQVRFMLLWLQETGLLKSRSTPEG